MKQTIVLKTFKIKFITAYQKQNVKVDIQAIKNPSITKNKNDTQLSNDQKISRKLKVQKKNQF